MKVGDGFYVFCRELIGKGYELEKRWISQVQQGQVRHIGGATDSCDNTGTWPLAGDPDPKKAFMKGKARELIGFAGVKAELRKQLNDLIKEERKLKALKFEDVRQHGNGITFEQFMRNWDCDF